jgi:hypothetical protein
MIATTICAKQVIEDNNIPAEELCISVAQKIFKVSSETVVGCGVEPFEISLT